MEEAETTETQALVALQKIDTLVRDIFGADYARAIVRDEKRCLQNQEVRHEN